MCATSEKKNKSILDSIEELLIDWQSDNPEEERDVHHPPWVDVLVYRRKTVVLPESFGQY